MAENKELLKLITKEMLRLGVPAHLKGYHYLRTSIENCIQDPQVVTSVTKLLYPDIAKQYNTSISVVERGIRTVIGSSWKRGDTSFQEEVFGYSSLDSEYRPTNSEFIAGLAYYIHLNN